MGKSDASVPDMRRTEGACLPAYVSASDADRFMQSIDAALPADDSSESRCMASDRAGAYLEALAAKGTRLSDLDTGEAASRSELTNQQKADAVFEAMRVEFPCSHCKKEMKGMVVAIGWTVCNERVATHAGCWGAYVANKMPTALLRFAWLAIPGSE